ncbi:hypothetical protein [Microbaculum marinum]|uniref:Uncharacterized protein n=1 Tax=Microbaculum marinum TaxID=1764581 RepID=A0AAW9RS71_9HYPH
MTKQSRKPRPMSEEDDRTKRKEHLNHLLDEGLEETFPASDPPAVVSPGHEIPTAGPARKK